MEKLIPYTDYIGISSYPFGKYPVPEDIPIDWFSYLSHLAPQKPIAVTETSYLAQDTCFDVFDNTIQGDEEGQYEYLLSLLESLDDIDAEFLIWFAIRDYDQLWERMEDAGVDEIFKSWRDTGLIGENGRPHKALYLWDQWLALPVSQ